MGAQLDYFYAKLSVFDSHHDCDVKVTIYCDSDSLTITHLYMICDHNVDKPYAWSHIYHKHTNYT